MKRSRMFNTWTDSNGVVHVTMSSGFVAHCGEDIPTNYNGAMPGWPPPPERDVIEKPVTCIACLGWEQFHGAR